LRIRHGASTRRFFIEGGFAQVRANVVTVLTQHAVKAEAIDTMAATRTLEGPGSGPEQQKAKERARAQLRVAHHEADRSAEPAQSPGH
jgi:F-type H+-transporting ATPase subunit epsilon